jgi:hypothetical protein
VAHLEFGAWFIEKLFKLKLWDYSAEKDMPQIENAAQEGGRAGGVTCERERGGAGIYAPASKGAQKSKAGFAGQVCPDDRSPPDFRRENSGQIPALRPSPVWIIFRTLKTCRGGLSFRPAFTMTSPSARKAAAQPLK